MNVTWTRPVASSSPLKTPREQLTATIAHCQNLIDQWTPEVESGLQEAEALRKKAVYNHKLGTWGLKIGIAGGVLAGLGVAVSMLTGHGNLGVWPGMAVFLGGIGVSSLGSMRRDNAQMEYQSKKMEFSHKKELLQDRLIPRMNAAREALLRQDTEEMQKLSDGLREVSGITENQRGILVGGTMIRKRA